MFATIYLPNFYLQAALRYEPESRRRPVALIEEQEKKPVVIQLNAAAESVGVRKGMTPSQALARYLQIIIKVRARIQENSIQQMLLQSAFTLSPYVEETGPGIATIEFTDNRDLDHKVARVIEQLDNCNLAAQAGIAGLPDTSLLVAHLARPVLQIANTTEFLAPLLIEILAIPSSYQ
jgi:nucleotidyltransferase/DNA polymerase involved in DNA repair